MFSYHGNIATVIIRWSSPLSPIDVDLLWPYFAVLPR